MDWFTASFAAHSTLWILGVWWVFSAAVSSMPQPTASSHPFYGWVFNFSHTLAGSIGAIMQKKFPDATAEAAAIAAETQPTVATKETK